MNAYQFVFLGLVFLIVTGVVGFAFYQLNPSKTKQRLISLKGNDADSKAHLSWLFKLTSLADPLTKLSLPKEGWEESKLRIKFMNAGFNGEYVVQVFFITKTILTFLLPILFYFLAHSYLSQNMALFCAVVMSGIGYYFPNALLDRRIASRQEELFRAFPDAVDLLVVCVEAGLALDAALVRVSQEISLRSRALASEIHLVNLELRAGSTREKALRNLALRTGLEEVNSLVSMLIQADRFGTSIADSLRVYTDELRNKRRQRAEEAAAKIGTKLTLPLIFCIFPTIMVVLLGPAGISIYRAFTSVSAGH